MLMTAAFSRIAIEIEAPQRFLCESCALRAHWHSTFCYVRLFFGRLFSHLASSMYSNALSKRIEHSSQALGSKYDPNQMRCIAFQKCEEGNAWNAIKSNKHYYNLILKMYTFYSKHVGLWYKSADTDLEQRQVGRERGTEIGEASKSR